MSKCPECGREYSQRWYGRHLISEHGYLYENDIPVKPKAVKDE